MYRFYESMELEVSVYRKNMCLGMRDEFQDQRAVLRINVNSRMRRFVLVRSSSQFRDHLGVRGRSEIG